MSINIESLKRIFFYFDEPVKYKIKDDCFINILPVSLRQSEIYLSSKDILEFDKNSLPDVKIIQMSYLQFLYEVLLKDEINKQKLLNILILCLDFKSPLIFYDDKGRIFLMDASSNIIINSKQFDEIKRIILYQNDVDYDDEYVNPEFKKKIEEGILLKNKNIEVPSLERKIAIITAHTGISKKEQLEMTYRSHSLLFQEVYEETEYTTLFPIAAFGGNSDKMERWIYKTKKNKFEDNVVSVSDFNKQIGGNGQVTQKIVNK